MDRNTLFGIVAFIAGVLCMIKAVAERKTAIRLAGKITGFMQRDGNYFPVIGFSYEGNEYSIPAANGAKQPKGNVGDEVEVLYRPKNQKYVNLVGSNTDIILSVVFLVGGAALIVLQFFR